MVAIFKMLVHVVVFHTLCTLQRSVQRKLDGDSEVKDQSSVDDFLQWFLAAMPITIHPLILLRLLQHCLIGKIRKQRSNDQRAIQVCTYKHTIKQLYDSKYGVN